MFKYLISIFTADCLCHLIQMAGVETIWELHTLTVINSCTNWSLCCQDMVVVSEQCDRGWELNYVVVYDSSSGPVANVTISSANCTNSECRHTLDVSSMRPANYTVSVAALNVVGGSRLMESRTISEYNVV